MISIALLVLFAPFGVGSLFAYNLAIQFGWL